VRERWLSRPTGKDWRPQALNGFEEKQRGDAGDGKHIIIEEKPFEVKAKETRSFEWLLRYAVMCPENN